MHEMLIAHPADFVTLAERLLSILPRKDTATVLALHGDLGAGKTTFVQELARTLGVTEYVTSPTFIVMRQYPIVRHDFYTQLVHIDAYRIASLGELAPLGFAEVLMIPQNLVCIEWAGRIEDAIPSDAIHIMIEHNAMPDADATRTVRYGYKDEIEDEELP